MAEQFILENRTCVPLNVEEFDYRVYVIKALKVKFIKNADFALYWNELQKLLEIKNKVIY